MIVVHATAMVDSGAELGEDVSIGPYSLIGPHVRLGARARVAGHVVIEGHAEIGEGCVIHPFANLGARRRSTPVTRASPRAWSSAPATSFANT